jgi:hypothetical protein
VSQRSERVVSVRSAEMSLVADLRAGRFTPEAYALVRRTFEAVIRLRRFPAPAGLGRWTPEAVEDTVQDFLADTAGRGRLARMALRAGDDREFRRLLDAAVKNHLVDQLRKSARVKLWRRLGEILAEDDRFIEVGRAWTLREVGGWAPWAGREAELDTAAWQVREVRIVRWRPDAKREGPAADRASLVAVCAAVITAAGAPVSLDVLMRVVARRFDVGDPPLLALIDAVDLIDLQAQRPGAAAGVITEADLPRKPAGAARVERPGPERRIAAEIWVELTCQERLQLPILDEGVRAQGKVLGMGRSQAAVAAALLKEKLRVLLGDQDPATRQEVVRHLQAMQARWADRRSGSPDA